MTITPNDLAKENRNSEQEDKESETVATRQFAKTRKARFEQPTKSILYQTARKPEHRKLRIDEQTLSLPVDAVVTPVVDPDGSGYVAIRIPAARVQVVQKKPRSRSRRPAERAESSHE